MEKYVCKKCKTVWYTSNTLPGQRCDKCGAELYRMENQRVAIQKDINIKSESK
jgi:rRNA maturation endonuclease Nob1